MNIFIFRAAEEQNGRTKDKIPYSWENEIKKSLALKQTKSLIFYPIEWLLWDLPSVAFCEESKLPLVWS